MDPEMHERFSCLADIMLADSNEVLQLVETGRITLEDIANIVNNSFSKCNPMKQNSVLKIDSSFLFVFAAASATGRTNLADAADYLKTLANLNTDYMMNTIVTIFHMGLQTGITMSLELELHNEDKWKEDYNG